MFYKHGYDWYRSVNCWEKFWDQWRMSNILSLHLLIDYWSATDHELSSSDVDIPFFFSYRYFGDSYWYYRFHIDIFFLFKWILGPLQSTYFCVKSIVGFLKNANYFAVWDELSYLQILSRSTKLARTELRRRK